MKTTRTMILGIFTFIATYMFVGGIVYLLSEGITYRESLTQGGLMMFMLIFGWIPSVIVCLDYDETYN